MTRHLLVIGGQRCGTTYLHQLLDAHPEVTMARPVRPEPKVFCSPDLSSRGHDWYLQTYFGHATDEVVLGEKSTSYVEDDQAPARAREVLGSAHVLLLVRDPVSRAISNWRFSTDNGFETRPLHEALEENLAGSRAWDRAASSVSPFSYLERGRFADYLAPWEACFPDTLRIECLTDLVTDESSVARLYEALGVDAAYLPEAFGTVVNASREPAEDLDRDLLQRLRAYYADSDRALRQRTGRELPWPSTG